MLSLLEAVLKSSSVRRVDHYLSLNSTDTTEPRSGGFVKVVVGRVRECVLHEKQYWHKL